MEGTIDDTYLAFISYDGPKLSTEPSLRTLIRRRAMRNVAQTRKPRGCRNTRNPIQHPAVTAEGPILPACIPPDVDAHPSRKRAKLKSRRGEATYRPAERSQPPIPSLISSPSRHLVVAENFTILNLAPLTGLRLGVATLSFFTKDPGKIAQTLCTAIPGSRKFISCIPARYGQVSSVSHAVDCIVAKLRQAVRPATDAASTNNAMLYHYVKALESIQHDLNDKHRWRSSETLCAVQLLGVFDVCYTGSLLNTI